jgi:uncharacterized membrane protein
VLFRSRMVATGTTVFFFLFWNLFLAWTPMLAAVALCLVRRDWGRNKKILGALLFIAWLCLYPNAPYIFTDFIHLIRREYPQGPAGGFFSGTSLQWYDLVMKSAFAFTAHVIGLFSLYLVHRLFRTRFGPGRGWMVAILAILVSGFGVYLGRFVRLNSWDIIGRPSVFTDEIAEGMGNPRAVLFSLIYSIFILSSYVPLYYFNAPESARAKPTIPGDGSGL